MRNLLYIAALGITVLACEKEPLMPEDNLNPWQPVPPTTTVTETIEITGTTTNTITGTSTETITGTTTETITGTTTETVEITETTTSTVEITETTTNTVEITETATETVEISNTTTETVEISNTTTETVEIQPTQPAVPATPVQPTPVDNTPSEVVTPVVEVETPVSEVVTPVLEVETPVSNVVTPVSNVSSPVAETPATPVNNSDNSDDDSSDDASDDSSDEITFSICDSLTYTISNGNINIVFGCDLSNFYGQGYDVYLNSTFLVGSSGGVSNFSLNYSNNNIANDDEIRVVLYRQNQVIHTITFTVSGIPAEVNTETDQLDDLCDNCDSDSGVASDTNVVDTNQPVLEAPVDTPVDNTDDSDNDGGLSGNGDTGNAEGDTDNCNPSINVGVTEDFVIVSLTGWCGVDFNVVNLLGGGLNSSVNNGPESPVQFTIPLETWESTDGYVVDGAITFRLTLSNGPTNLLVLSFDLKADGTYTIND